MMFINIYYAAIVCNVMTGGGRERTKCFIVGSRCLAASVGSRLSKLRHNTPHYQLFDGMSLFALLNAIHPSLGILSLGVAVCVGFLFRRSQHDNLVVSKSLPDCSAKPNDGKNVDKIKKESTKTLRKGITKKRIRIRQRHRKNKRFASRYVDPTSAQKIAQEAILAGEQLFSGMTVNRVKRKWPSSCVIPSHAYKTSSNSPYIPTEWLKVVAINNRNLNSEETPWPEVNLKNNLTDSTKRRGSSATRGSSTSQIRTPNNNNPYGSLMSRYRTYSRALHRHLAERHRSAERIVTVNMVHTVNTFGTNPLFGKMKKCTIDGESYSSPTANDNNVKFFLPSNLLFELGWYWKKFCPLSSKFKKAINLNQGMHPLCGKNKYLCCYCYDNWKITSQKAYGEGLILCPECSDLFFLRPNNLSYLILRQKGEPTYGGRVFFRKQKMYFCFCETFGIGLCKCESFSTLCQWCIPLSTNDTGLPHMLFPLWLVKGQYLNKDANKALMHENKKVACRLIDTLIENGWSSPWLSECGRRKPIENGVFNDGLRVCSATAVSVPDTPPRLGNAGGVSPGVQSRSVQLTIYSNRTDSSAGTETTLSNNNELIESLPINDDEIMPALTFDSDELSDIINNNV